MFGGKRRALQVQVDRQAEQIEAYRSLVKGARATIEGLQREVDRLHEERGGIQAELASLEERKQVAHDAVEFLQGFLEHTRKVEDWMVENKFAADEIIALREQKREEQREVVEGLVEQAPDPLPRRFYEPLPEPRGYRDERSHSGLPGESDEPY